MPLAIFTYGVLFLVMLFARRVVVVRGLVERFGVFDILSIIFAILSTPMV